MGEQIVTLGGGTEKKVKKKQQKPSIGAGRSDNCSNAGEWGVTCIFLFARVGQQ